MWNALIRRYVTMDRHMYPQSVPYRGIWLDPHLKYRYGSFGSHESAPPPQTATRSVHTFFHGSPVCQTHTDTQTTLRATSVEIGRIDALFAGDAAYSNYGTLFMSTVHLGLFTCRQVKAWSNSDVIFAYDVDQQSNKSTCTDHVTDHVITCTQQRSTYNNGDRRRQS